MVKNVPWKSCETGNFSAQTGTRVTLRGLQQHQARAWGTKSAAVRRVRQKCRASGVRELLMLTRGGGLRIDRVDGTMETSSGLAWRGSLGTADLMAS